MKITAVVDYRDSLALYRCLLPIYLKVKTGNYYTDTTKIQNDDRVRTKA